MSVSLAILTACGSSKQVTDTGKYEQGRLTWPTATPDRPLPPQSQALLDEARSWLGTPYKYGGESKKGVDCSGLVLKVYNDAIGIPLPRNSREQHEYCSRTSKSQLIPGDLIFFATGKDRKRVSHVGIFVGDNLMIHASASKGVILSDITAPYYNRTFIGAGYVDRYHAMIEEKRPKSPSVNIAKTTDKETPIIPIIQTVNPTEGYTLTTVESLPKRQMVSTVPKTQKETTDIKEKNDTDTKKNKSGTSVKTVATTNNSTTSEPTVEEARTAVLNSIKEKEL